MVDVRKEMLDHETYVNMETSNPQWLPVARFKRKMDISDADWDASQPRDAIALRKGRRDMLRRVLEAAEHVEQYYYTTHPPSALPHLHLPCQPHRPELNPWKISSQVVRQKGAAQPKMHQKIKPDHPMGAGQCV